MKNEKRKMKNEDQKPKAETHCALSFSFFHFSLFICYAVTQ